MYARDCYDFPRALIERIQALTGGPDEVDLHHGVFGRYHKGVGAVTDLALDRYHQSLLTSPNPDDQYLGAASVIYWGRVTANHPNARSWQDLG